MAIGASVAAVSASLVAIRRNSLASSAKMPRPYKPPQPEKGQPRAKGHGHLAFVVVDQTGTFGDSL